MDAASRSVRIECGLAMHPVLRDECHGSAVALGQAATPTLSEAVQQCQPTNILRRYPGARVDSESPFYQLNIPEVYENWNFSERFPGHEELRKYMAHIDKTLQLRKDTYFDARVIDSTWDKATCRWTIKTQQGHVASAKYLILATGLLHRTYTPDFPGLKDYKGEIYHSGAWKEDFSAKGKKIGLIGAGATAVQITQELGKEADELTVFLRRPSYCLPMHQRNLTEAEQKQLKIFYPALFKSGRDSLAGFPLNALPCGAQEVTAEERERLFDRRWAAGGFQFLVSYQDVVLSPESNKIVYDYWRRRVCERLTDPEKQKILAPEKQPYYFNTKRKKSSRPLLLSGTSLTILALASRRTAGARLLRGFEPKERQRSRPLGSSAKIFC